MKPEWCPQKRAKIEAQYYADWLHAGNSTGNLSEHAIAGLADSFALALLEAHQRGRREGLEDAALFLDKNMAGGAWVHAIRAKAQEVKT